ncbi:hypothetical protein JYT51_01570 [Candidatus Amoebophilus asiaticus]|nr:hypothetical protein [Candidatus Amoebophilus asiaticus]
MKKPYKLHFAIANSSGEPQNVTLFGPFSQINKKNFGNNEDVKVCLNGTEENYKLFMSELCVHPLLIHGVEFHSNKSDVKYCVLMQKVFDEVRQKKIIIENCCPSLEFVLHGSVYFTIFHIKAGDIAEFSFHVHKKMNALSVLEGKAVTEVFENPFVKN